MVTWAQAASHRSWVRKARGKEKLHPTPMWRRRIHKRRSRRLEWRVLLNAGWGAAEIAELHAFEDANI